MKLGTKIAVATVALAAGFGTFQLFAGTGGATYGPYTCIPCGLVNPKPDEATLVFLDGMDNGTGLKITNKLNMAAGDRIVVCNRNYCVDYYKTNSANYLGENARANTAPGQPSGSGGTGGGGSEGGRTGGGAAGGGSVNPGPVGPGEVTVRRPVRENPR